MSMMSLFMWCFLTGFSGYLIGRAGHVMGGQIDGPDHWIYGALLFVPGLLYTGSIIFFLFAFGLGLIISDLKDLLHLKYFGPDKVEVVRFWHID